MKNVISLRNLSIAMVACIFVLASCSKSIDNPLSATDSQNVNSESVSSTTSSEASDLTNSVMTNVTNTQLSQGRVSGQINGLGDKDGRLKGATITISGSKGPNGIYGTITIDYGAGVTNGDVTRKGEIIIAYTGSRLQAGSKRTITFSNFYRNNVRVSGSSTVTVNDTTATTTDITASFHHTTELTLTFPDSTKLTRIADFTVVWDYVIATPLQSTVTHKSGGSASGTTRKGGSYVMAITKDIVYRFDCLTTGFLAPLSGEKTITVTPSGSSTATLYTLNFGNGTTCSNSVTISVNGKSKTITINKDGN